VEIPKKFGVKKLIENAILDLLRDLVENIFVFVRFEGLVLVDLPLIFEMLLNLVLQCYVDWCIVVKLFEYAEKL
jgi:hypothetical protein